MNNFEQKIKQVNNIFKNVFNDLNISKEFVRSFLKEQELTLSVLTSEQVSDIKKAINILIENAKLVETRKMQQQHFMPLFAKIGDKNFVNNFNKDEEFRLMFIQLLIVFLDKTNLDDKDAKHHIELKKIVAQAASLI